MSNLGVAEFCAYFEAIHGYAPFPWQRRLAGVLLETGKWPELLDIPTGLGKTSVIDVALFVLAARPELSPRRIALVVDRRVVVDQAASHARRIQGALRKPGDAILLRVATALRKLWSDGGGGSEADDAPFEVAVLRGGMPRDEAWAQRPDRPVVVLSTVDQVGSRLLFRGYGVSAGMSSIHAGLLGYDALILLDEVQLSTAFAETLCALRDRWRRWHEPVDALKVVSDRWAFVQMSATPISKPGAEQRTLSRFGLDAEDRAHPVVATRSNAHKLARLAEPIAVSKTDAEQALAAVVKAFSAEVGKYLEGGAQRVVVIVNRVRSAREIHATLETALKGVDVALLTGRMRPLDRMRIFGDASEPSSLAARVAAKANRPPLERPVVIVSTQTIEAGADFDFDALVTECASLDALKQRFGRLDRRGESTMHIDGGAQRNSATILVRKDQIASKDDPVYGSALAYTWEWLEQAAGEARQVDFGIAHFPKLDAAALAPLCSEIVEAPITLPAHIDAWAQTNPRGEPDPDVALWLHGPKRGAPDVRVVWRADITEATLADAEGDAVAAASLAVSPPSSLESISVSITEFNAWITSDAETDLADVEGARTSEDTSSWRKKAREARPYFVATRFGVQRNGKVHPEATLVVPSTYGGIRAGNWDPGATEPVQDLGDLAQLLHRGRPVLRLVPDVVNGWRDSAASESTASASGALPTRPEADDPEFSPRTTIIDWLKDHRKGQADWQLMVDAVLESADRLQVTPLGGSPYYAVRGPRTAGAALDEARKNRVEPTTDVVSDDDDGASYTGAALSLAQHLIDVERWAKRFALNVGLPPALADDLALAARLHDIGKADPRFQQMLYGGSEVRMATGGQLLAKSNADFRDRHARELARTRSKYPQGYRHELLSVAMLETNLQALAAAHDPDLVLHLVGSHHGWCRPFAPACDPGPSLGVEVTLDGSHFVADAAHHLARIGSGVADRFWQLTERYGWWTLAWFEALVRLADHRASEERAPQSGPATTSGKGS